MGGGGPDGAEEEGGGDGGGDDDDDEWEDPWEMPDEKPACVLWVMCLPLNAMLYGTLPDVARPVDDKPGRTVPWIPAGGTSIPDALSSMYMAKEGRGDMAISSSIGSNVFDILVGLPVPTIIKYVVVAAQGNDP